MAKLFKIIPPLVSSGNVYRFTSDAGVDYEVVFARKRNNLLNATIAFGVLNDEYDGEEYSITNKGELYSVMHTVVEIIKAYYKEHPNIRSFEFSGEPTKKESGIKDTIRLKLYERYAKNIFDGEWTVLISGNKMQVYKS